MLLSIITLNYKKPELTLACIASAYKQYQKEFQNGTIELIVVDNGSGDGSVETIEKAIKKEQYAHVNLIANTENGGFGKGCNLGAHKAKGEYLLFLNNDTFVKDKNLLVMAKYLQNHTEVTILGGLLRNTDGTPQASAGKFYTPLKALSFLLGLQRYGLSDKNPTTISQVDWVKGAVFMIQKNIFEKLGGFDEKIFMYTEDMELCYRANLAGYKTFFYPDIMIVHKEHGSANRTFAIVNIYKNLLYFYKKHRSRGEYLFLRSLMATKAGILLTAGKILKNTYLTQTYEQALKAL
ncbi:MAG TPA: glycosyltransferase family 2 protein [Methylomirabilota bacterium]|nr:glycosyltransferase family 2 protein [Methylomirabilota bacterium]